MSSYQFRKFHCVDKAVVRTSYLHNGISFTGKISSLYWIGAMIIQWNRSEMNSSHILYHNKNYEQWSWSSRLWYDKNGKGAPRIWNYNRNVNITLNVWGPSYLGLTRSISWLLMFWLLTSPGHHEPWYWLCRIGRFLSHLRKDFNYLRRINVEKWHKM